MMLSMKSFLVLLVTISYCDADQFCAAIIPDQAAGASGFVAMDIEGGKFIIILLQMNKHLPLAKDFK